MAADWSDGPAVKVADGVFRIPLPLNSDALKAVNAYVIDTGDGAVLIDPGWGFGNHALQAELVDGLRDASFGLGQVLQILVTHVHRDHYTQAALVRQECGAPIALSAGERASLEMYLEGGGAHIVRRLDRLRSGGADELADAVTASGIVRPSTGTWEYPDQWLAADSVMTFGDRKLRAIHTPGHTRGHLCFYDADAGLLFAGDHVLPHITPSIGYEPEVNRRALADYVNSLQIVLAMPDARLLPAHGGPSGSVHERAAEIVAHHNRRLQLSLEAVGDGKATAYAVARVLPWTRREKAFTELGEMDQMLAVCETAAHLDVLLEWRQLDAQWENGVCRFRLADGSASGSPGRSSAGAAR